ncbi:ribosome biogenesis GTPase YlqF [Halopseudomonas salegens]|uniref:Ribosome biogenesis GTPase A n=1 Tax=Halopseudomonas salegens TaxID=1434072 RepID=A0A1H2EPF3_9GAMM|nr:ribosome biogenesis GTPase YlqF [Halopseudomonas salegens]SDT97007.1 Ras superfamily GTP-binding protein YlqF [Halopseudomonas salegens]
MSIQWYPGHMHKAQKAISEALPQVDLLIEVLDARIPYSSENPAIERLRGDKPCIKVLSKSDLADPELTTAWQASLEQERGVKTFPTNTAEPGRTRQLIDLCRKMVPDKVARGKNITVMIVGIPNVGKSTLINALADRVIARTGNEPAVTKNQQRINLGDGVVLLDTPGILWPKIENPDSGYRLAATGAIKNTAMAFDDVSFFVVEYLREAYPELLRKHFKLEALADTELAILEQAGIRRGAIRAGGRVDLTRISEMLINELRAGKMGRITLETPAMIVEEKAAVAAAQAKKAEQDAERKRQFKAGSRNADRGDSKAQPTAKASRKKPRHK